MEEKQLTLPNSMVSLLCEWFEKDHREMYWRSHPLPYYVWVSEIMLQQTRVETVREYFARFIKVVPDIESLAVIDDDCLMKLWEGLGYYHRARNLKKAANLIMEQYKGQMPSEFQELLKLPGIGEYTAGAVASIAFGKAEPVVDGNVLRVLMRVTENHKDIQKESTKKELRQELKKIIPKEKPGIFNQALMELGAVVCIPNGLPKCSICPIKKICMAEKKGIENDLSYAQQIPYKAPKKARKKEKWTVLLFEKNGTIAVNRREEKGLLAGMWEFPMLSGHLKMEEIEVLLKEAGLFAENFVELKEAKHVFSHIEWYMKGYQIRLKDLPFVSEEDNYALKITPILTDLLKECRWETRETLKNKYSLPSALETYKKQLWDEDRDYSEHGIV